MTADMDDIGKCRDTLPLSIRLIRALELDFNRCVYLTIARCMVQRKNG